MGRDQRQGRKAPLYRKVNTRARRHHHWTGDDARHDRNTKRTQRAVAEGVAKQGMGGTKQRGLDYTPLYRFLLSKVGAPWDEIHREAVSRLDSEEPIYRIVARSDLDRRDYVCVDEGSLWSGLYVDGDGRLQKVAPDLQNEDLEPDCPCCTYSFNGVPLKNRYDE